MPTVKHPTFADVTEEVSVKDLPDWLEQGWLSDQVTEPVDEDEPVDGDPVDDEVPPVEIPKPGPRKP